MKKSVVLPLGFAEMFGDQSLIGAVSHALGGEPLESLDELEIVFCQTSEQWKMRNKSPHLSLMPEHFPLCFARDIMHLASRGIRITFEVQQVYPKDGQ